MERYPNNITVVVEKDEQCKILPDLLNNKFSISREQKVFDVYSSIRNRISRINQGLEKHSLFLFADNLLPQKGNALENLEISVGELYASRKDPEDGILYLQYSNVDPTG
jgi:hypothetical protein